MSITENSLTSNGTGVDASSFTTASITPGASRLVLLSVQSDIFGGAPAVPSISGCSLTWIQVTSIQHNSNNTRITLFRALGTPSTGAITIDFSGVTQGACNWTVTEYIGVDTTGTNGSGAVGNVATGFGFSTTPQCTLAGNASGNATYGTASATNSTTNIFSPGTGFTELYEINTVGGFFDDISIQAEWRSDNVTSVTWTLGSTQGWACIGIEIVAASGGSTNTITPDVLALTTSFFTPSLSTTVMPSVLGLVTSYFTPTLTTTVAPTTLPLVLSFFTPGVGGSTSISPGTLPLVLSFFTPLITSVFQEQDNIQTRGSASIVRSESNLGASISPIPPIGGSTFTHF